MSCGCCDCDASYCIEEGFDDEPDPCDEMPCGCCGSCCECDPSLCEEPDQDQDQQDEENKRKANEEEEKKLKMLKKTLGIMTVLGIKCSIIKIPITYHLVGSL